jgi:putative ABC transport system permease protein
MESLVRDVRLAVRMLARSPGFTAVVLLTLAVGVGANTAIFSVVNAVLLRPLPYAQPERLVAVYQTRLSQSISRTGVSYPNYADLAGQSQSFERLAAIRMHDFTMTERGEPMLVPAGTVTGNAFDLFRAQPLLGRGLINADDGPEAPSVAVLGEPLWRERFAGDPEVVGKTVLLDAQPVTIVGVMPAAFRTPPVNPPAQLWLSLTHDPVFRDLREKRGGHYLTLVGRLKDGVPLARAEAELATIEGGLARAYPKENEGWAVALVPLAESLVGRARPALLVLVGAVGLVFLIACANIANLLLIRAGARTREVAIRTALGAGRPRLIRQFMTECLLLGLVGGGLGLALAAASMRALRAWIPSDLPRMSEIQLDGRVLLFSLGVSLVATVVFGLAPALQASGPKLSDPLREGALGTGESRGKRRLRNLLVVGETALSFVLLIGAGLLARSFLRLQEVALGFEPRQVLMAGLSLPRSQYRTAADWSSFYARLVERLKAEPGVEGAAAALPLPLQGSGLNFGFSIEGRPDGGAGADLTANYTAASGDYFRVMGVKLVSGRFLSDADGATSPKVCVVSSTFARRFFESEDPIGRRLVFGFTRSAVREIVGVVGDVRRDGLGVPPRPEMYVPFAQDPWWASYLAVRTTDDPGRFGHVLRSEIRALDPSLPVDGVEPMTQAVYESVAEPRFRTTLLGLFGLTAFLLAVIGISGVLSYNVTRRTREMGIRLALGAARRDILGIVLSEGLGLTAVGLAFGLAGALVLTRSLSSLLFEVQPIDPATYVAVVVLLLVSGLVASWIPARRAIRIDPVVALRHE